MWKRLSGESVKEGKDVSDAEVLFNMFGHNSAVNEQMIILDHVKVFLCAGCDSRSCMFRLIQELAAGQVRHHSCRHRMSQKQAREAGDS